MNISFLPEKIKKALSDKFADEIPLLVVRSSSTVDGGSGESYLVSFKDRMFIFSRNLGESDYSATSELFGKLAELDLKRDGMNTYLNASFGDRKCSLKFSSFEEKSLKTVIDAWRESGGGDDAPAEEVEVVEVSSEYSDATTDTDNDLSPLEGLAAALMYVSAVDDDISDDENHYITALFAKHRSLLNSALNYYKRHSFEDLIAAMKTRLTNDQKLCYLANILELAMKDFVLHSSERNMISHFIDVMGISKEQSDTVRQVLLIKNKISALDA